MYKFNRILIALVAAFGLVSSPVLGSPLEREQRMEKLEIATFAGGCFWCMEPPFEKLAGVTSVISGYAGGSEENPTYEQVSSGSTGYAEAIQVTFDPAQVSYQKLLETFWRNIDPTQVNGQFADRGRQYRSAIFFHTEEQQKLAEESKLALEKAAVFSLPIATEIVAASSFYPAEEYHQDYYKKNPIKYRFFTSGSGRKAFIERTWGAKDSES